MPLLPSALREALLDALAVVLPAECVACGHPDRMLCGDCRAHLEADPHLVHAPSGLRVVAGTGYRDPVPHVVLALKNGATPLAAPLAPILRAAFEHAAPDARVELCAVPSSRAAVRRRGYDPVPLVLARAGLRSARVLRPARPHPEQKTLGRAERRRNLHGVHRARHPLDGRRFLLVDDVVTTGTTLDDAARALREAGAEVVGAIAVAATALRTAPRANKP